MRKVKKLFAFLLSAQMLMFSLPATVSAEENVSSDGVQTEFGGFVDGGEQIPDVASLLPMVEKSETVYIDHSDPTADQEGFTVREALKNITYNEETVKILYAFGESDSDEYKSIGLDDTISLDGFHLYYDSLYGFIQKHYYYYYFIVGTNADDQLNNEMTKKYRLTINVKTAANDFADNVDFELWGVDGEIHIDNEEQGAWSYTNNGLKYDMYSFYQYISKTDYDNNKSKSLKMKLTSGYTSENVTIYSGSVYNEDYLENAVDITSDILGGGYMLKSQYNYITAVITMEDGSKQFIIMYYGIKYNYSQLSYSWYGNSTDGDIYKDNNLKNQVDHACKIVKTSGFDNILSASLHFKYYNEDEGILYFDATDKIDFACTGYFKSLQEINAAGKQNMKDTLFSSHNVDFSESDEEIGYVNLSSYGITKVYYRTAWYTVIDVDGKIYNIDITAARYDKIEEPVKELEPDLSGETYLKMQYAYKQAGGTERYNSYKVCRNDDSYYRNGYQTLFILNDDGTPVADGTVIYPYYDQPVTANIFRSGDLQITGQTPVEFHSGETLQYSASAENRKNLGNYWVTFVTQHTGGAKLFVNGLRDNDEGVSEREIFLDNEHGFYHDILIANVGDEKLEGITVTLENAVGVALDPYWTITDTSVKSLNAFTKTSPSTIDNIAKIRLVPENEDEITEISGTLKITTSNGGSVSINLTGFACAPKIVTGSLKNGVKYVPYSSLIQTDNMNSDINVAFKVIDGKLPDELEIGENGELYGIPTENGLFTFTVQASCALNGKTVSDTAEYTIYIADNSDENVDAVNEDDQGYTLKQKVSKNIKVYYSETSDNASSETPYAIDSEPTDNFDYFDSYSGVNIKRIELDSEVFCSEGEIYDFRKFYIDGIELHRGTDYYVEPGSTKITVTAQTFEKAKSNGVHTLSAEFRDVNGELKRSAQNVYLEYIEEQGSGGSGGNNSGISNNGGTINPDVSYGEGNITARFSVVDETGAPISGIMLELHSTPKYATTDKNGVANFNKVEFGKHTLYIKSLTTGKKVSASFTFKEGEEFSAAGNVITLKENDTVYITARFNGERISVTAEKAENVGSGAASLLVADKATGSQENVVAVLIAAVVTVTAFVVIRKRSDRKYM